jgi:hypothetical protein
MVWMPYFYNSENALNPLQGNNKLLFIPSYFKTINIANLHYNLKQGRPPTERSPLAKKSLSSSVMAAVMQERSLAQY